MTESAPLVTIGIPCFNAESTIARAVRSALSQDWPALEIIVVDDASRDGSVPAAGEAMAGDDRARIFRRDENGGPAATRNTILDEARGEFIVFFDDDDESLASRVRTQVETLVACEERTGGEHVACFASGRRLYPNGYVRELAAIGSRGPVPNGPWVADYLLFYRRRPEWFMGAGVPACALAIRRRTLTAAGRFDPAFRRVEDIDLAIRLAFIGAYFIGTSTELFVQHATQAADKSPESNLDAETRLAEKYSNYLRSVGRYEYVRRWPRLRYWHFKRDYLRFALELSRLLFRYPFAAVRHLWSTGPARIRHERRMQRKMSL